MDWIRRNRKWVIPLLIAAAGGLDYAVGGPGADALQVLVENFADSLAPAAQVIK